jgi:hypothetical protein
VVRNSGRRRRTRAFGGAGGSSPCSDHLSTEPATAPRTAGIGLGGWRLAPRAGQVTGVGRHLEQTGRPVVAGASGSGRQLRMSASPIRRGHDRPKHFEHQLLLNAEQTLGDRWATAWDFANSLSRRRGRDRRRGRTDRRGGRPVARLPRASSSTSGRRSRGGAGRPGTRHRILATGRWRRPRRSLG